MKQRMFSKLLNWKSFQEVTKSDMCFSKCMWRELEKKSARHYPYQREVRRGWVLQQKNCKCAVVTLRCCPGGWNLILAGGRFNIPAEISSKIKQKTLPWNLDLVYVPGKQHVAADRSSRRKLYKSRVVTPTELRQQVLQNPHAAHQ